MQLDNDNSSCSGLTVDSEMLLVLTYSLTRVIKDEECFSKFT